MEDAAAFIYAPVLIHGTDRPVEPIRSAEEEEEIKQWAAKQKVERARARLWDKFLGEETRNPSFGQPGHTKERVTRRTLYNAGGSERQQVLREWEGLKRRRKHWTPRQAAK